METDYKGYTINIRKDEFAENPRTAFDCIGKLICFHNRYELGDKKTEPYEKDPHTFKEWIEQHSGKDIIALPVYMLDHSGITISTTDTEFKACDPHKWDWGKVGYIYITKDKIKAIWGKKRCTKALQNKTLDILNAEISTYDDYLTGNVWEYFITKKNDYEIIDSCCGFYSTENIITCAQNAIDEIIQANNE